MRAARASVWAVAAVALAAVLALVAIGYVGSGAFLERMVARAVAASDGRLEVVGASGSLYGSVRVTRLTWRDAGLEVVADEAAFDFALAPLFGRRLQADSLQVERIAVTAGPGDGKPFALPESLALPIRVAIDDLQVRELLVHTAPQGEPTRVERLRVGVEYDGERYHFRHLSLATAQGRLAATVSVADEPPYDLEAVARVAALLAGQETAIDVRAWGTPSALQAELRTRVNEASVVATVELAPLEQRKLVSVVADVTGFDLSRIVAASPVTRFDGRITARAPQDAPAQSDPWDAWLPLDGTFALSNALAGTLDAGRVPVDRASGEFHLTADRIAIQRLAAAGAPGAVTGAAEWRFEGGYRVRLAADAFDLRGLHRTLRATTLRGEVVVEPADGGLGVSGRLAQQGLELDARARLQGEQLSIASAQLRTRDGSASFSGEVQVVAPHAFRVAGTASGFDPARFAEVPAGRLNGQWRIQGRVEPALALTAAIQLADSRWRGLPLSGLAEGSFEGSVQEALQGKGRVRDLKLSARLGANGLVASGSLGGVGDRMAVQLDAQRLRELDGRLEGRLQVQGELHHRLDRPGFAGKVRGDDLRFEDRIRIGVLQAGATLPPGEPGEASPAFAFSATATRLVLGGRQLDRAALQAEGTLERHRLALEAGSASLGVNANLRAEGGLMREPDWRWQGRVLSARQQGVPAMQLAAPAAVSLAARRVAVSGVRLEIDGPQGGVVDVARASVDGPAVVVQATASRLSLQWLAAILPLEGVRTQDAQALRLGVRAEVTGSLDAETMKGQVLVFRESGDLRVEVPAAEGGTELIAAGITRADLRVDFDGDRVAAVVDVRGAQLGSVQARARSRLAWDAARQRPDLGAPLEGTAEMDVPSLAWTRPLAGETWRFDGRLRARLVLAGALGAPRATGEITGSGLVAEQREIGMRLTDGQLVAQLRDDVIEIRMLRFSSGEGSVQMRGSLRAGGEDRSDAVVTLTRLPIPLGAGQRLVLSGEASAQFARSVLRIRGKLRADEGVLELTGNDAPRLSRDIVVVRRAGELPVRIGGDRVSASVAAARQPNGQRGANGAPDRQGFRVLGDLQIELGDRFRVFGGGVEARLAGAVVLSGELPGGPRLNGTVRVVQGTYVGFGQTLQIERGALVFSGPVDNPAIDIVAYRRFLPVEAGVAVTGTANTPRLELVSRPDVPEADKLSWLVLGIGSETARTSGETAALQAAAATVLATGDSPFARGGGIAGTFGLDVLSIRTEQLGAASGQDVANASPQDSIVTLGKRLSDRLFVSYEQSLRGVQNLLRLQYEITDRLSVRVKSGTDSSIDLTWTFRYD